MVYYKRILNPHQNIDEGKYMAEVQELNGLIHVDWVKKPTYTSAIVIDPGKKDYYFEELEG